LRGLLLRGGRERDETVIKGRGRVEKERKGKEISIILGSEPG